MTDEDRTTINEMIQAALQQERQVHLDALRAKVQELSTESEDETQDIQGRIANAMIAATLRQYINALDPQSQP